MHLLLVCSCGEVLPRSMAMQFRRWVKSRLPTFRRAAALIPTLETCATETVCIIGWDWELTAPMRCAGMVATALAAAGRTMLGA